MAVAAQCHCKTAELHCKTTLPPMRGCWDTRFPESIVGHPGRGWVLRMGGSGCGVRFPLGNALGKRFQEGFFEGGGRVRVFAFEELGQIGAELAEGAIHFGGIGEGNDRLDPFAEGSEIGGEGG